MKNNHKQVFLITYLRSRKYVILNKSIQIFNKNCFINTEVLTKEKKKKCLPWGILAWTQSNWAAQIKIKQWDIEYIFNHLFCYFSLNSRQNLHHIIILSLLFLTKNQSRYLNINKNIGIVLLRVKSFLRTRLKNSNVLVFEKEDFALQ